MGGLETRRLLMTDPSNSIATDEKPGFERAYTTRVQCHCGSTYPEL